MSQQSRYFQGPCFECGHQHDTMASVWTRDTGKRFLCHENDHSCYTDYSRSKYDMVALMNTLLNP